MDYEGFKKEIYNMSSINLTYYKEKQMKRRIDSLISKHKFEGYQDYISEVRKNQALYDEFLDYITINVSEFYRNTEQWVVLEKDILPKLLERTNSPKVWSAACSTGDEPYTLAMILSKFLPLSSIRILATDIDKSALLKAKNGMYIDKSLEKLPVDFQRRYFTVEGKLNRIKDEIKNCVQFKQHNLLKDEYPKGCDLIVCRNVLIYFTDEAKGYVYPRLNGALKKGGVLFVGSTEQLLMPAKYNFQPYKTFFYTKDENPSKAFTCNHIANVKNL